MHCTSKLKNVLKIWLCNNKLSSKLHV
jgi:hypothetical protein